VFQATGPSPAAPIAATSCPSSVAIRYVGAASVNVQPNSSP
jgi:hypothetical protein